GNTAHAAGGAQLNAVVTACGGQTLTPGNTYPSTVDPAGNPFPPTNTAPATTSTVFVAQAKIAVTSTAVQLPNHAGLLNGIIITACGGPSGHTNTGTIFVGGSGVNTTADGTGNGDMIAPGAARGYAVTNSNQLYINGTANDCVS